jgi:DNA-binding MarR family transcriptional regulator
MAEMTNTAVERLLLLMSGYERTVSAAMLDIAPDPELAGNMSLVVLCTLDLEGPRRPGELQEITGLSSGGVSKLLDRMEAAGVVKRTYGGVPGDNRGVLVSITRRGKALVARLTSEVAARLPESRVLVDEVSSALSV